jgi:DNA-binding FadR family transcriptional regulator
MLLKSDVVLELTFPRIPADPLGLNYANKHKLLANLMETRMMIEPEIAFLAAERATQANLHKLGKILERMVRESGDHSRIDIEFHTAIAECTQNDVLGRILPIINESIYVGYTQTSDVPGSFEKAVEFHTRIFQAISRRDGELARHEIENHLRESMKDMKLV